MQNENNENVEVQSEQQFEKTEVNTIKVSVQGAEYVLEIDDIEGRGLTLIEALRNLAFVMELKAVDSQEEYMKIWAKETQPIAFEAYLQLFEIMGGKPFSIKNLLHKIKMSSEEAKMKIDFISTFGYVEKIIKVADNSETYKLVDEEAYRRKVVERRIQNMKGQLTVLEQSLENIKPQ